MVAYADTSFLYSLYGHDANSEEARTMGTALKVPLAITPLQRHELRNAYRLAVFRKVMTAERCEAVLAEIEADTKSGVLVEPPVSWAIPKRKPSARRTQARSGRAASGSRTSSLSTSARKTLP